MQIQMIKIEIVAFLLMLGFVIGLKVPHSHDMGAQIHAYDWGHYNSQDDPNFRKHQKYDQWISRLQDNINVGQLSIPGTHDTGTYPCRYQLCDITQTQSWNIKDQLDAGIRYLDLRVQFGKKWTIAHGRFEFHTLQQEIEVIRNWLRDHQREFVILQFQQEPETQQNKLNPSIAGLYIVDVLNQYGVQTWFGAQAPTVGQLRGKAWIVQACGVQFSQQTLVLATGESGETDQWNYYLQNTYKVYTYTADEKVKKILNTLQMPCQDGKMKINFLSGAYGVMPYWWARTDGKSNESVHVWLGKNGGKRCLGVNLIDYPGTGLIGRIIASNFW